MKKFVPVALALFLACPPPVLAYDEHRITSPSGQEIFKLRFYGLGDGPFARDGDAFMQSTWNLDAREKAHIIAAMSRWAEILRPPPGGLPAVVNVGTYEDENALGSSTLVSDGRSYYTLLEVALQQGKPIDPALPPFGAHGEFIMGKLGYDPQPYMPSPFYRGTRTEMAGIAFHELAHGLGMLNVVMDRNGLDTPHFEDQLNGWARLLVDDNGRAARPGQAVLCEGCANPYRADAFDARKDQALLVGKHIGEALEGGLPGVPVKMLAQRPDGSFTIDNNYMSHIELRNSLMSHQSYRNYTSFMEAELAVMQDLGYAIDRRQFYGRSVYGSGLSLVNDRPYFARDSAGAAYLDGQYNTATLGTGLHVYGSHNRIRQAADLLTGGPGGVGVRVDGEGNALTIDPGVRVHALGINGQGIMVAYGKDHSLAVRGEVLASDVGLRFDFGNNSLGNSVEYRGSYIRQVDGSPGIMLPELQGPLASRVDITGRVAGGSAAIYMSPNALVGHINVMQGASLQGDIVSDYAEVDAGGKQRLTTVSFGQRADASGRAVGTPDAGFALAYDGDIVGIDNLALSFDGGLTALDGDHAVHQVQVRPEATVAGNGSYLLASGNAFVNRGTVAPGNSIGRIDIDGDYTQASSARLLAEFDARGAHDVLAVTGQAALDGTLALQAAAGWFADGSTVQTGELLQAGSVTGGFAQVQTTAISPTLRFAATPLGGFRYAVSADRPQAAYSQYGRNTGERQTGRALRQVAAQADEAVRPLFAAVDFSASDGSEVAGTLAQLGPAAYSAGMSASLHRERQLMALAAQGADPDGLPASGWRAYATPLGGWSSQDERGSAVAYDASLYGLAAGVARRLPGHPGWTLGLGLDVSDLSVSTRASQHARVRTTAFGLGARLHYSPGGQSGPYAYGALRAGLEDGDMDRDVAVGGYRAEHSSDWTGHSASAMAGAGYRWPLTTNLLAGPVVSLGYARVSRPGVTESGDAVRLEVAGQHMDALQSRLGLAARLALPGGGEGGARLQADGEIAWVREWLDRDVVQSARFAGYAADGFTSRNAVLPRDSLGLRAGLRYLASEQMSVSASLSGQTFGGYDAAAAELSLRYSW